MNDLLRDLKQSLRIIQKRPGFAAAIILSIALGVGANAAIFSVANVMLIRPLPYPEYENLIRLRTSLERPGEKPRKIHLSEIDVTALRQQSGSVEGVAAWIYGTYDLIGGEEPVRVFGSRTTANATDIIGVKPILGRGFLPDEDLPGAAANVALIGYAVWQNQFAGDPDIVGRNVQVNSDSFTVVGVMPSGFHYPYKSDLWVPMGFNPDQRPVQRMLHSVTRLKKGVSLEVFRKELDLIIHRLAQDDAQSYTNWSFDAVTLRDDMNRDLRSKEMVLLLMAGAGFLLLIACVNVANMLLGRALEQSNEIAVRCALGIGRFQLVRQLLTQGLALALISGALGLLFAYWIFPLIAVNPVESLVVIHRDLTIDYRVFGFAFLLSLLVGVLFSLIPAFKMSRPDLRHLLQEGNRTSTSRSGRRLLKVLVAVEVAIAVVLLVGSGLMFKSLQRLQKVDAGFDTQDLLVLNFTLSGARYPEHDQQIAYFQDLTRNIEAVPGVESSCVNSLFGLRRGTYLASAFPEGWPENDPDARILTNHRTVTPGFVKTMGLRLLAGRDFTQADHADAESVVIVSETFAKTAWPGQDPLDRRTRMSGVAGRNFPWMRVVGVVGDVTDNGGFDSTWYAPFAQRGTVTEFMDILVRTSGDPIPLLPAIRKAIWAVDKDQAVADVVTAEQLMTGRLWQEQSNALIFGMFAALSLLLAIVGIYGIQSYSVLQQTHEMGVRMVFGARPKQVILEVLRQGMSMSVLGIVLGLLGAFGLTRYLSSVLPDVTENDPMVFVLVSAVILAIALVANYVPSRRVTRVDPVEIIRY